MINIIMKCDKKIFKEMVLWHPTKHLFKNYYLMRDNAYGVIGPSLWGIVKVIKHKEKDHSQCKW